MLLHAFQVELHYFFNQPDYFFFCLTNSYTTGKIRHISAKAIIALFNDNEIVHLSTFSPAAFKTE